MAVATPEPENGAGANPTGKRKRISFAEPADPIELAEGRKRRKGDTPKNEKQVTEPVQSEENPANIWDSIITKAKDAGINYEDAVKDVMVEKLASVVSDPNNDIVVEDYKQFMNGLSKTFEKLHRYPKMISKLLVCIRVEIIPLFVTADKKFKVHKPWAELLLPQEFLDALTLAVSLLPSGHMIDLWKTIHHNLDEECISKICDDRDTSGVRHYLSLVVTLLTSFMESLKVSDMVVVSTQIDKITELMTKMKAGCLSKLATVLLTRAIDQSLMLPFLRLAYCWVELQTLFSTYNAKYAKRLLEENEGIPAGGSLLNGPNFMEAIEFSDKGGNLACSHPFLAAEPWTKLSEKIEVSQVPDVTDLWLRLVAQKLRYLEKTKSVVLDAIRSSDDDKYEKLKIKIDSNIEEAVRLIAFHNESSSLVRMEDACVYHVLRSAANTLKSNEILMLGEGFLETKVSSSFSKDDLTANPSDEIAKENIVKGENAGKLFCQSVITEVPLFGAAIILNGVRVLAGQMYKKSKDSTMKNLLKKMLSEENLSADLNNLIVSSSIKMQEPTNLEETLLQFFNELLDSTCNEENMLTNGDMLENNGALLEFLSTLPIAEYPSRVKNVIFLVTAAVIVKSLASCQNPSIAKLITVLEECATSEGGNAIFFKTNWIRFFELLSKRSQTISFKMLHKLIAVVLAKLYVSPQIASGLEDQLAALCKQMNGFDTDQGDFVLAAAEILVVELESLLSVRKPKLLKPKVKHAAVIGMHLSKLRATVSTILNDNSKRQILEKRIGDLKSISSEDAAVNTCETIARAFRACVVVIESFKLSLCAQTLQAKHVLEAPDNAEFADCLKFYMEISMLFLKSFKTKTMKKLLKKSEAVTRAKDCCLGFLNNVLTFEQSQKELNVKIPEEFLSQLWRICMKGKLLATIGSENLKLENLPTTIYETSSIEEFGNIVEITSEEIKSLSSISDDGDTAADEIRLYVVTSLMDQLIDAKLSPEKKVMRKKLWEEYLYAFLGTAVHWKNYQIKSYLIVLDFQLKLLRRVHPICSLDALANCFASVSCVPLKQIPTAREFKIVFCKLVDIINAFAMHRTDVISFRTHILLQSFKNAVEYLAFRADQRNNLPDADIFEYRSCAYALERLCQSLKAGEKHFARVVPYFLAIMMRQLDVHVVYPTIKVRFLNGCYKLLDIADEHAISQMNTMLPTGAREIFKSTYDFYKKFYQFKGKV